MTLSQSQIRCCARLSSGSSGTSVAPFLIGVTGAIGATGVIGTTGTTGATGLTDEETDSIPLHPHWSACTLMDSYGGNITADALPVNISAGLKFTNDRGRATPEAMNSVTIFEDYH